MAKVNQLLEQVTILKKKVNDQGLLIQQQRETIKRLKGTKVALVAGRFAAEVDPEAEAARAREFTVPPIKTYEEMVDILRSCSQIEGNTGILVRNFLTQIGR